MAIKQLSDGGSDGAVLGQSATDKVAFHGATAIAKAAITVSAAILTNHTTTANIFPAFVELREALIAKGLFSAS